jgi:hypothetical protein
MKMTELPDLAKLVLDPSRTKWDDFGKDLMKTWSGLSGWYLAHQDCLPSILDWFSVTHYPSLFSLRNGVWIRMTCPVQ